jgi:hypothetical protein
MNVNHLQSYQITATNRRWDLVGDPPRVLFTGQRRLDHLLIGGL